MFETLREKPGCLWEEESIRELLQCFGVKNKVLNFLFEGDKAKETQESG